MTDYVPQLAKRPKPAVRTLAAPKVPLTLVRLLERLTELLAQDEVDDDEWEDAFAEALAQYHLAAYAHGAGLPVDRLTPQDHKLVQEVIDRQKEFLKGFRQAWAEGRYADRPGAAARRADMYADATLGTWWMGRTRGYPLPSWPGDGTTQCKTRCRCAWDIEDLGNGDANAYWRLGAADHCQTCMQRSEDWSPLQIRGGELQLKSYTVKGWVTIHGHHVFLGGGSSGGGGGSGGAGGKTSRKPVQRLGESAGGTAAPTAVESAQAKLTATSAALDAARKAGDAAKITELEAERVRNHGALYRARKAEKGGGGAAKPIIEPVKPPTPAVEALKPKPVAKPTNTTVPVAPAPTSTPLATPGVIRGSDHAQSQIDRLVRERDAAKAQGNDLAADSLNVEIKYQKAQKNKLLKAEAAEDEKQLIAGGGTTDRVATAPKARVAADKLRQMPMGSGPTDPNNDPRVLQAQAAYRQAINIHGPGTAAAVQAQEGVDAARALAMHDVAKTHAEGRKAILAALGGRPPADIKIKMSGMEYLTPADRAAVQEGAAFFRHMVGKGSQVEGKAAKIQIHDGEGRAYFSKDTVHLYSESRHELGETTVHELGHWLEEKNKKVQNAALRFRDRRTKGQPAVQLNKLKPGTSYDDDEIAKPDRFYNVYVGRIYSTKATEVTSMVLQEFYARPKQLLERDPDMFNSVWEAVTQL